MQSSRLFKNLSFTRFISSKTWNHLMQTKFQKNHFCQIKKTKPIGFLEVYCPLSIGGGVVAGVGTGCYYGLTTPSFNPILFVGILFACVNLGAGMGLTCIIWGPFWLFHKIKNSTKTKHTKKQYY